MMFVNDIIPNINSNIDGIFSVGELESFLILYADDQVLFATSPTSLQSMLNDIETYCKTWGIQINVNKTKFLYLKKAEGIRTLISTYTTKNWRSLQHLNI